MENENVKSVGNDLSSMPRTPAVGVIGSGYWGKNLVRNYYLMGALRIICDKNETVLQSFKEQFPGIETCTAFENVLAMDDIEGVVIATPAETHYSLAREALLSGKHVYVEKPLVLSEDEGEDLINLAEEHGKTLMVGHLLQYHPVFIRLKELALSGELGRINYIYSNRLNLGKIRREENILWSFAPHDISMILTLAGEMPESVLATGGNYLHQRIADVTTTHLEFPSGLHAHIFVSWLHPFKEQKLIVVGDRKMAVFDDTQPWEDKLLLYPHQIKWQNGMPVPEKAQAEREDILEAEPLRVECEHFLRSFSNGSRPITDGREGVRVLKILNAAQRSMNYSSEKISLQSSSPETKNGITQRHGTTAVHGFFAHKSSVIDEDCEIGSGTRIWHFSHILTGSKVGEDCNIGQNVVVGPEVDIGKGCKIQNNVSVFKGVTLEGGVFCGPSMVFTNIYNPRAEIRKMDQVRPTLVKKGATLGANCTVVCGVTIGSYAFVGAGAVVTRDVPDFALVVGNPARQIGWTCQCGERLGDELKCLSCGNNYTKENTSLKKT